MSDKETRVMPIKDVPNAENRSISKPQTKSVKPSPKPKK